MAFAIIISEKGGAERREVFDKDDIHVGRVQGNDLMLPKGNVSKRHAKLAFRDGRFVVTDLKSTNGTYVNGRKITSATVVREGDKIYVGDFVLRFEATPGAVVAPESAPYPAGAEPRFSSAPPPGAAASGREGSVISHIPLEREPDDSNNPTTGPPGARVRVPAAPRLPAGLGPRGIGSTQMLGQSGINLDAMATPALAGDQPSGPPPLPHDQGGGLSAATIAHPAQRGSHESQSPRGGRSAGRGASSHRIALATLVDRVSGSVDIGALREGGTGDEALAQRVDRVLRDEASALRGEGDLPEHVSAETLVRDAHRELLGLGAFAALLDDEDVSEIHAPRFDYVYAIRGGQQAPVTPSFSTDDALRRVIARLCQHAGAPLLPGESVVERTLPRGVRLSAVLSPTSMNGHAVVLRKRRRVESSLDELVRVGTISRAMATFLGYCALGRANVMVSGASGSGASFVASALAALSSADERVAAVQEPDELIATHPSAVVLLLDADPARAEPLVRAAANLGADRLIVHAASGAASLALLEVIGEGARGVLASVRAPTLRQGLGRLVPQLCAARPGLAPDAAREWLASSFDIVVEVSRLRDGRARVLRISEPAGVEGGSIVLRDVFSFVVERTAAGGAIEGSFHASGYAPRLIDDLRARGLFVDPALFSGSRPGV